ncbi:transcription factor TCP12-like [Mangifera indica]|uniref:transcription factor TCP12-like n=1 Tax=Mangifera indica TaxID=29780 RepID=UPI001CF9D534|nr:transcription factor TCP12-like [Mangifera indica]
MFPSINNYDPFPSINQTMLGTNSKNPSSSPEHHHPYPFLHFSEPFLADDDELHTIQLVPQQEIISSSFNLAAQTEIATATPMQATKRSSRKKKSVSSENNSKKQAIPRERAGKKDRHSKIHTAQGPRDRRMRLSLQIARKFFDLQDMLGFDKPSKTIEWLFFKSKAAIQELTESFPGFKQTDSGGGKSISPTSDSEVVSGGALVIRDSLMGTSNEAKNKNSEKAQESRKKARARARERTIEKIKGSKHCSDEVNPKDLKPLGSSTALQTVQKLVPCSQEINSSLKVVAEEECGTIRLQEQDMDSVSIIEKFLGITPGSSSTFSNSHNTIELSAENFHQKNAVFTRNWDKINNDAFQYAYCTMTNMKELTGNLQGQDPCAIYMFNKNDQAKRYSSNFTTSKNAHQHNPNSVFMSPSNAYEQNPSSIPVTTSNIDSQSHLLENQYLSNPNVSDKYCRWN